MTYFDANIPRFDGLSQQAEKLWPVSRHGAMSQYLKEEWRRAVSVVRQTSKGWAWETRQPRVTK